MKNNERVKEIRGLIQTFAGLHLNEELTGCAMNLCDKLGRMRKLDIGRGRKEIWAAAIVYLIARLNFLFDKTSPCFITAETVCDFFGTKKTTTANKASLIEQTCKIGLGDREFCTREIAENFSFVQLPNGMILPASMVRELEIALADEEESAEIEEFVAEKKRREEEAKRAAQERRAEINREIAEKKRKKKEAELKKIRSRQFTLFDEE
jgi:hypothetical protein